MEKKFPIWGFAGLLLVATFWYINWAFDGLRTHYGFFPLWLGYCLVVDGLTVLKKGESLVSRSLNRYILLFIISAPAWWLFELINEQAQFWHYSERDQFSDIEYFLFASLSFSTVIPAVFGTSELVGSLSIFSRPMKGPRIGESGLSRGIMFVLGLFMFACIFIFPEFSAAFVWMSIYLLLDPLNHILGNRTLLQYTAQGNWREVYALWAGCLICGFFWEMWNYYSSPKWFYTVPYVDFWFIFEMPLLGYLGYLPFALELFALYHLVGRLFGKGNESYLKL